MKAGREGMSLKVCPTLSPQGLAAVPARSKPCLSRATTGGPRQARLAPEGEGCPLIQELG